MDYIDFSVFLALVLPIIQHVLSVRHLYEADEQRLLVEPNTESDFVSDAEMAFTIAALYDYRAAIDLLTNNDELCWYVKPRSQVWFMNFLMSEYDNNRWIQLFRMSKDSFLDMCAHLRPHIYRQDTNYRQAVCVECRVGCALYKLVQGVSFLTCSELFGIGISTSRLVFREVILAITVVYKDLVSWPVGNRVMTNMLDFKRLSGLPSVHGAIDATHFQISKPKLFPEDYYYFKSGCYTMVMQAVVDSQKRFIDVCIGMPGSVNDSRILRRSHLYGAITQHQLLHRDGVMIDDFSPYLIGDKGYPCLPWLLVPHKNDSAGSSALSTLQRLFNRRLSIARVGVENAFGQLKLLFVILQYKMKIELQIVPDVIFACCILHNILLGERNVDVQDLLRIITFEAEEDAHVHRDEVHLECQHDHDPSIPLGEANGEQQRQNIAIYLGLNYRD